MNPVLTLTFAKSFVKAMNKPGEEVNTKPQDLSVETAQAPQNCSKDVNTDVRHISHQLESKR